VTLTEAQQQAADALKTALTQQIGAQGGRRDTVHQAMAAFARTPPLRGPAPPPRATPDSGTLAAARSVLGVGPEASRDEILAAHARLIRRIHPDAGGTDGLAAHLNAARDRLLEG
jgi:hypothetical protein